MFKILFLKKSSHIIKYLFITITKFIITMISNNISARVCVQIENFFGYFLNIREKSFCCIV